jgi:hypothetical protein
LFAKLALLPQKAPGRTEGRHHEDDEGYCIIRYLRAVADGLSFPCSLTKSERPDYFLDEEDNGRTAIEVTRVTTQKHEQAQTELERRPKGTVLMGESYLREPGQPLVGRVPPPHIGDEPERRLAELALAQVKAKRTSLSAPGYQPADRDYLLLYNNSHLPVSGLEDVAPFLAEGLGQLPTESSTRQFSRIAVLDWRTLLLLEDAGWRILTVPD